MVHVQLKGMSKTQSSNVDGRCDGEEISLRDQREGTSLSDSGLHEVFSMSPLSKLKNDNTSCFMKYVLLGILLGYGLSFISPEFNDFIFYHFTIFCRELNLPDQIWIWMDKYIFYGKL